MAKKGRPFEPGNKFGHGRPPGSRNKRTLLTQQLLDTHADSVLRKALTEALKGDPLLLRTLLGYILPRRKEAPPKTGPLPVHTAAELDQSSEAIFQKVATGKITLQEAHQLSALLEIRRGVLESRQFEERLRALEESAAKPEKRSSGPYT